jgi:20S proteasome alpha/beta subunit
VTLIVGILCADGVVLGADSAATYGVMGQPTIRQTAPHKLAILEGCVVVGVSGPVGLSQRFGQAVGTLWAENKFAKKNPVQAMTTIREALAPQIQFELNAAAIARNAGVAAASQSALAHTVVALPCTRVPALLQFDQNGAPEAATLDLPFVAIGSGQLIADPFLAFLRRLLWPGRAPSLQEGIFSVLWTLVHAIATNPGGVAGPTQIVTLTKDCKAAEVPDGELEEHRQAIDGAEKALTSYVRSWHVAPQTGEIPPPPKP